MKRLYARAVLWLIGPALRFASRDEPAAESIGWVIHKHGQLSIIRTPEEAEAASAELGAVMSESIRLTMEQFRAARKSLEIDAPNLESSKPERALDKADPRKFLESVMNDPRLTPFDRIAAAKALMLFSHSRQGGVLWRMKNGI